MAYNVLKSIYLTNCVNVLMCFFVSIILITEGKEKEITKWQEQWTSSTKGAVSK